MSSPTTLLDGLVIFVTVVKAGSFTKAAQNTGHSTSFISKEMNKLESRLGVRLMNRTTRSLSLTPEGESYFQQCQQIISDAEHAENSLSGQQAQPQGLLKVSCPSSFGNARMQHIISGFLEAYPLVNLDLDFSNRKVDMVAEGFDVIIRASHQLDDSSLISRRVFRSHAVTIASPRYLARYGTPKTPEDLSQHKMITYSYLKQPNVFGYTDQNNQEHQVPVNSRVQTNDSEMELFLCVAGQGIVRLPYFILNDELETGKLVELFSDCQKQYIDVYVIYPSRKHMSSKVRRFIDFVVDEMT